MKKFWLLSLAILLTGCPKVSKIPPSTPPAPPTFEKTFGDITIGGVATLLIRYKDINLLIDPVFEPIGPLGPYRRTRAPGLRFENLPAVDYLLLTDTELHHKGGHIQELRKNLKIMATPEGAAQIQAHGFSQAKGLAGGQRILLKKNENFLFVSVLQSRNPASGRQVNGYLLEFDNGKNVFVSGETVDEAVMREFVYALRDDGKQIELAFIYGGGLKNEGTIQSCDEACAALMIGLLQPRVAVLLQADSLDAARVDQARLRELLKEQIYSGDLFVPEAGDTVSF